MSYCCPKCGKPLSVSDVEGYPFVCRGCDENFYQFEAVWEDDETGYVCPKCGNTEHFTASAVVCVFGDVSITPDGWDYLDCGYGEVDLAEDATLYCEKCGHEDNWHMFEEGYVED